MLAAIRDEEVGEFNKIPEEDTLSYARGKHKYQRFTVNRVDTKIFKKIIEGSCKNGLTASDSESLLGKAYMFYRYQLKLGVDFKTSTEDEIIEVKPPRASKKKDAPQAGDFLKYWPSLSESKKFNLELLQNCINYGLSILEIILEEDDEDARRDQDDRIFRERLYAGRDQDFAGDSAAGVASAAVQRAVPDPDAARDY